MSAARKRWLPFVLMLTCFAMVESSLAVRAQSKTATAEDPLSPTLREQIEEMIKNQPGIFFRSTIRNTNRTVGVIQYHLNYLERNNLIVAYEVNNYKGYFPTSMRTLPEKQKKALIMLRTAQKQEIIETLMKNGEVSQKELTTQMDISDQNLSYHLKVLEQMELITRNRTSNGKVISLDPEIRQFLAVFV